MGVTGQNSAKRVYEKLPVGSFLLIFNRLKIFSKTIFAFLGFNFDAEDMHSFFDLLPHFSGSFVVRVNDFLRREKNLTRQPTVKKLTELQKYK